MWRLIRASFSIVVMMVGIILGVFFIDANRGVVNVQFPLVARESGEQSLGITLIVAAACGMGFALVIAFIASVGMSLHVARLKRQIKLLQKEVDSLRNLPLLDEEIERETDDEDDDDILHASRTIDIIPDGPVRGGSTVAPVDDDEDYDDDRDSEEDGDVLEAESAKTVPGMPASPSSTRKIDIT